MNIKSLSAFNKVLLKSIFLKKLQTRAVKPKEEEKEENKEEEEGEDKEEE